jgi:hypothetical protein
MIRREQSMLMLMVIALLTASIAWAKPVPTEPTEDEWKSIIAGEVVTRPAPELTPPGAYAWAEIEATPDAIWNVLIDPAEVAASSNTVTSCELYRDDPHAAGRFIGFHYVLNVAWTEVTYFILRDFRPSEGYMSWTLDPSKTSDLAVADGFYLVKPGRTPGHNMLYYTTLTDSGRKVPQWLQTWLSSKALRGYLAHVKNIAEK